MEGHFTAVVVKATVIKAEILLCKGLSRVKFCQTRQELCFTVLSFYGYKIKGEKIQHLQRISDEEMWHLHDMQYKKKEKINKR